MEVCKYRFHPFQCCYETSGPSIGLTPDVARWLQHRDACLSAAYRGVLVHQVGPVAFLHSLLVLLPSRLLLLHLRSNRTHKNKLIPRETNCDLRPIRRVR